jgi:hypothetical protein
MPMCTVTQALFPVHHLILCLTLTLPTPPPASGCTFVNGRLFVDGARLDLEDCHISGSFLGNSCVLIQGPSSASLHRCTVQVGTRSHPEIHMRTTL